MPLDPTRPPDARLSVERECIARALRPHPRAGISLGTEVQACKAQAAHLDAGQ